jgi:hypothetical protein
MSPLLCLVLLFVAFIVELRRRRRRRRIPPRLSSSQSPKIEPLLAARERAQG